MQVSKDGDILAEVLNNEDLEVLKEREVQIYLRCNIEEKSNIFKDQRLLGVGNWESIWESSGVDFKKFRVEVGVGNRFQKISSRSRDSDLDFQQFSTPTSDFDS